MTWPHITRNPSPPPCVCVVPNTDRIANVDAHPGSRWQCDVCGKIWTLIEGPAWTSEAMR